MAETYPLSLPNLDVASVTFLARTVVAVNESPFSYSQQVYQHQGMRWEADIKLPPMNRETAEQWSAFLLRLRGRYGTFLLGDPNGQTPRGAAASTPGTPLVAGASQTGEQLNIDGAPINTTGYLLAGDYIQIGSGASAQLYKVLEDADTDGSGATTLNLFPNLRTSPADNATIFVANCVGNFRLASNETSWQVGQAGMYGITFGAQEAL